MKKVQSNSISLARAVETFVRGFAFTRSFTHPYVAERRGPVWVVRDGPRTSGAYRREEWIATGDVHPTLVDWCARAETRGLYALCIIEPPTEPIASTRNAFASIGYRLGRTEAVMVHSLHDLAKPETSVRIEPVRSRELLERINRAAGQRQLLDEHVRGDSPIRMYAAMQKGEPVGWARSGRVKDAAWCSSVYVKPAFRRRGIGRSLMQQVLLGDRAAGMLASVLTASHAGEKLYASVGYQMIGTLLLFTPKKRPV